MMILNPENPRDDITPKIDGDLIAFTFLQSGAEYDHLVECLVTAIVARSMMQFGEMPEVS